MDFLGIGLPEILVILIIGVIVVGPKRLPELAVQVARVIRNLRGYATDVTSQMREELEELTREYERMREELQEFKETATRDVDSVRQEVDTASRDVRRRVREAPAIIESSGEPEPDKRTPPAGQRSPSDDGS